MPNLKFSTDQNNWTTAIFNDYWVTGTWATVNSNTTTPFWSIDYGNGIWLAGHGDTNQTAALMKSTNGISWATISNSNLTATTNPTFVKYSNNIWIIASPIIGTSVSMRSSTDTITWTTLTNNMSRLNYLDYGNGMWVAVGSNGMIRNSTDTITWTTQNSNFWTTEIFRVKYGNGIWVATGHMGQVRTSTDTITWTTTATGIFWNTATITGLDYGQNKFILTCSASVPGTIDGDNYQSTDGLTWERIHGSEASWIFQPRSYIFYGNGKWVGGWQTWAASTNGINWVPTSVSLGSSTLKDAAYGNGIWIAGLSATGGGNGLRTINHEDLDKKSNLLGNIISINNINGVWAALSTTGQIWTCNETVIQSNKNRNFIFNQFAPSNLKHLTTFSGSNEFAAISSNQLFTSTDLIFWTTFNLTWTTVIPPMDTRSYTSNMKLVYGNGIWMLGNNISTDGINWTTTGLGTTSIRAITYANNLWMIGGDNGLIRTSTDTISWNTTINNAMGTDYVNAIAYGNGLWVAGGFNGRAMRSTDTINWVTTNIMFGNTIMTSIAYANGIWVAVGYGATTGLNQGRISNSTDGITWTTNLTSNFFESTIRSVIYKNNIWVAVGESGRIRTSTNGISWSTVTNSTFPTAISIRSIEYANNLWVAGGQSNNIRSSTDLITWVTLQGNFGTTTIHNIVYGQNMWYASGETTGAGVLTIRKSINPSSDLNFNKIIKEENDKYIYIIANNGNIYYKENKYNFQFWDQRNINISDNLINGTITLDYSSPNNENIATYWSTTNLVNNAVTVQNKNLAYGNGLWVVASSNSGVVVYSTNTITWTTSNGVINSTGTQLLSYEGGLWFSHKNIANGSYVSTDAVSWTTINIEFGTNNIEDMAYGNGKWVIVGGSASSPRLSQSNDAVFWTTINTGFAGTISSISYGNGLWIIVGAETLTKTSTDAISWTTIVPNLTGGTSSATTRIRYSNGRWFAIANAAAGISMTSTNGIDWLRMRTNIPSISTTSYINYGNGIWIITTPSGDMRKSTNGIDWTTIVDYNGLTLQGLIYGNDLWASGSNSSPTRISISEQNYNYKIINIIGNNASYYSTDMISWTTIRTAPAANTVNAIISKD